MDTCSVEGAIRLVNGTNATDGTVEVCIGGRYGTVCDDRWDELDARVVCRDLGYSGDAVPLKQAFFGGSPSRPIHLDNVRCSGSETSLLSCAANPVGVNNCDHSEDAGVKCNGMLYSVVTCFEILHTVSLGQGIYEAHTYSFYSVLQ